MLEDIVYFDNAAATRLDERVWQAMHGERETSKHEDNGRHEQ